MAERKVRAKPNPFLESVIPGVTGGPKKKAKPAAKAKPKAAPKSKTVSNALGSVVGNSGTATKPPAPKVSRPKSAPKSKTVSNALGSVVGDSGTATKPPKAKQSPKPKVKAAKKSETVAAALGTLTGDLTPKQERERDALRKLLASGALHGSDTYKSDSALGRVVSFAVKRPGKLPGTGGKTPLGTVDAVPSPSDGKLYTGALSATYNIGRATAEDPVGVTKATARSVPLIARGMAGAGVELVTHPRQFIKQLPKTMQEDYARRYGDVLDDPKAFRARLKKDGVLPEVLDAASLGVPTVSAAGRIATKVAETGAVGDRAKAFVEAPRPNLRVGAGPREVREQSKSPNAVRLAAQRAKDKSRAKTTVKRQTAVRKDGTPVPMRGLVPGPGEVVKKSVRAQARDQRKTVARLSARTQHRVVRDLDREVRGKTGVVGNAKNLTREEAAALPLVVRIGLPADPVKAVAALRKYKKLVLAERARTGARPTAVDNLELVDKIIADPGRYLTPRVREAADAEVARGKRVAKVNPSLSAESATRRQFDDQAAVLGVERGGTPIRDAMRDAGKGARKARAKVKVHRKAVLREEYKAGKAVGRAEVIVGATDRATEALIAKAARAEQIALKAAANYERRAAGVKASVRTDLKIRRRGVDPKTMAPSKEHSYWVVDRSGKVVSTHPDMASAAKAVTVRGKVPEGATVKVPEERRAELLAKAKAAKDRAAAAKTRQAELRAVLNRKPVRTNAAAERAGGRAMVAHSRLREAEGDVVKADARVAELKKAKRAGTELVDAEPIPLFVGRVAAAADRSGLAEPGYVYSREFDRGGAGAYAGGNVGKAVQADKRYRGDLFKTGRADSSIETLKLGVARGIKRAHNWHGVADTVERTSPSWGRNMTVQQIERELRDRGLDPKDWSFIDTGRFREALDDADLALIQEGRALESPGAAAALRNNTMDLDGAMARYKGTGMKLTAVPRPVAEELQALTQPGGSVVRGFQKFQGLQSKVLLGTNPTFVPIQVVSNTPLAMLALRGNVKALLDGQVWYRRLDQQTKDVVDEYMGLSASESFGAAPRFGEAADSNLTRFYEAVALNPRVMAFREGKANPLNWNRLLDAKQNDFFRKAVFHNAAKRSAGLRMSEAGRGIVRDAEPLIDALRMPPGPARDAALRRAEPEAERIADRVNEMLGDYTTFTARERKFLKSSVMFYGFLRWATQLAFYTLPVKHPVATSIVGKLGQLHNEEVISLLSDEAAAVGIGTPGQVEDLLRQGAMPYVFGRVWFTKNGNLESVDATRLNPLLGPIMDTMESISKKGVIAGTMKGVLGLPSPAISAGMDAAYGKSSFTGADLVDQDGNPLGASERFFAGQMLNTAFPIRVADQVLNPGSKSDDSIPLIAPRVKSANTDTAAAREQQKRDERGSDANVLLDNLLPIARSKRDGTMRGVARLVDDQKKRKAKRKPTGGSPASGVLTQDQIDAMTAAPEIGGPTTLTQAQIDAMLGGG